MPRDGMVCRVGSPYRRIARAFDRTARVDGGITRVRPGRSPSCAAAVAASLLLVCGGCDGGAAAGDAFTARDSAGIRIVESRGPSWAEGEEWRVGDGPVIHIGVVDGAEEYQFSTIAGVWRRDDGRIVVADAAAAEIRSYDADGAFLGRFGRQGDGPGEFPRIIQARPYRGDSIAVWAASRMAIFDGDGRLGRSLTLTLPTAEPMGTGSLAIMTPGGVLDLFSDGSLLVTYGWAMRGERGEFVTGDQPILRLSPVGDSLGVVGSWAMWVNIPAGAGEVSPPAPFMTGPVYAAHGTALYKGQGPDFRLSRVAQDGRVEAIVHATHLDLGMTDEAREAYRDAQRQSNAGQANPEAMERALRSVEFPATLPPYVQALVDAEGHLWVRHYRLPGATGPEVWSVFAPEGPLLGAVETPERLQVRQVGSDFVLGIWTDELDIRYIRMYALDRR